MGWFRERPTRVEIAAKSNDDNTLTDLRDTVIRCVQKAKYHIVRQFILVTGRVVLFQKGKMFHPRHVLNLYNLWVLELKKYVVEILAKGFPEQTSHVFKYKYFRSYLTDGTDSLREHIPFIVVRLVLTTKRKRLARWASGNKLYLTGKIIIMHSANIGLVYLPIFDSRIPMPNIVIQIVTGIFVPFVKSRMIPDI